MGLTMIGSGIVWFRCRCSMAGSQFWSRPVDLVDFDSPSNLKRENSVMAAEPSSWLLCFCLWHVHWFAHCNSI